MDQGTFINAQQEMAANRPAGQAGSKKQGGRNGKRLWLFIGAGFLCLLIGLFFARSLSEQAKIRRYELGTEYLQAGDYEKALDIFTALGDYEDAQKKARYAGKGITYLAAKESMKQGAYKQAVESFSSLGGFKDADELATECEHALAYETGKSLYEEGDYAAAIENLEAAGGYNNSETLLRECRLSLTSLQIEEAMASGNYEYALSLLDTEFGEKIENREAIVLQCRNEIKYAEADTAFRDGLYYTASDLFKALGSFRDAEERAKECILDNPKTGEVYHNPDFSSVGCSLEINPNTGNGTNTFCKIYIVSGSGEILVSSVFIKSGSAATVKLPAGTYILKVASSKGEWYGENEMFGPNGVYQRLKNGSSDRFTLERHGDYVLTMNVSENGNVGSQKENMSTF